MWLERLIAYAINGLRTPRRGEGPRGLLVGRRADPPHAPSVSVPKPGEAARAAVPIAFVYVAALPGVPSGEQS